MERTILSFLFVLKGFSNVDLPKFKYPLSSARATQRTNVLQFLEGPFECIAVSIHGGLLRT